MRVSWRDKSLRVFRINKFQRVDNAWKQRQVASTIYRIIRNHREQSLNRVGIFTSVQTLDKVLSKYYVHFWNNNR